MSNPLDEHEAAVRGEVNLSEAELLAAMEGVLQGEAWAEIIADLEDKRVASVWDKAGIDVEGRDQLEALKLVMLQDNAAVTLFQGPGASWRTRPLKIRARAAWERFEQGFWGLQHLPGETMVADIGTKALGSSRLRALAEMLGMRLRENSVIPEEEEELTEIGEKTAAKVKVVYGAVKLAGMPRRMRTRIGGFLRWAAARGGKWLWTWRRRCCGRT